MNVASESFAFSGGGRDRHPGGCLPTQPFVQLSGETHCATGHRVIGSTTSMSASPTIRPATTPAAQPRQTAHDITAAAGQMSGSVLVREATAGVSTTAVMATATTAITRSLTTSQPLRRGSMATSTDQTSNAASTSQPGVGCR
jgi:hypothetical protein